MKNRVQQILTFCRVVQQGSFVRAAEQLGISKAAVSQQISQLEQDLGVQLLQRSTRKLWLTDPGQLLYAQAARLSAELDELEAVVGSFGQEAAGDLYVEAGRHYAMRFLVPRLHEFRERFPKVTLHLEVAERVPNWADEALDVVIGYCLTAPDNYIMRAIGHCTYRLLASPSYLEQNGTPTSPQELSQHQIITHSMRRPVDVIKFRNGREQRFTPIMYLNQVESMIEAAKCGVGLIWVHDYAVEREVEKGTLVPLLSAQEEPLVPLRVYYRERRIVPPKIRAFIDFVTPE